MLRKIAGWWRAANYLSLGPRAAYVKQALHEKLIEHKDYIAKHGEDLPEIRNWKWGNPE